MKVILEQVSMLKDQWAYLLVVQDRRLMFHYVRYQLREQVAEKETNDKQKLHLVLEQNNVQNWARKQTHKFNWIQRNKNICLQKVENKS